MKKLLLSLLLIISIGVSAQSYKVTQVITGTYDSVHQAWAYKTTQPEGLILCFHGKYVLINDRLNSIYRLMKGDTTHHTDKWICDAVYSLDGDNISCIVNFCKTSNNIRIFAVIYSNYSFQYFFDL